MSKVITMTVPDAIHAALTQEGAALEQEPGEVLKGGLMIAYQTAEGWNLKLKPVPKAPDPNQTELQLK